MTEERAIDILKLVVENAPCEDCPYYGEAYKCPSNEDCIITTAMDVAIEAIQAQIEEENKSCMTCVGQVKGIYCIGCFRAEEKHLGDNYEPLEDN